MHWFVATELGYDSKCPVQKKTSDKSESQHGPGFVVIIISFMMGINAGKFNKLIAIIHTEYLR
jgi:hypothetical protein